MKASNNPTDYRTSLAGVCSILDINYRTATAWTRWYSLAGTRGRLRYGAAQMFKFKIISNLSSAGFSKKQIQKTLKNLPWMLESASLENVSYRDPYFVIFMDDDGEPIVNKVATDAFVVFTDALMQAGKMFSAFSMAALAGEVLERIQCFQRGEDYQKFRAARRAEFVQALADGRKHLYERWELLLAPYTVVGHQAFEDFNYISHADGITKFQHKASGQIVGFDVLSGKADVSVDDFLSVAK